MESNRTIVSTPQHVLDTIRRSNEAVIDTIIETGKSVNGLIYGIPPGIIDAICNAKRFERNKLAALNFPIWECRIKNKSVIEKMMVSGVASDEAINALLTSIQVRG
ncbi:hypothetical protein ICN48_06470 [Polynucleobacter sp. JS-Safj-400b-B2]|uniref:hypothetical protein n=1 Tax=Polynucleobacter sp. JS-Safj-400b-B2 TaxID=2576921 RepID=UPI001C0D4F64|nr:hypothetical protein [Polynucleobacter sp. JS-Safj-400b-B2]MBU3625877.1 hypothetical protein [Polynucleobacter sp. JS-Safj-400b-B2]